MKKNLLLLISALFISMMVSGQSISTSVVNSSGGEGQSESVSIVWSVGEIMTQTFQQGDVVLTQGVLQPEIIITSVEEIAGLIYDIQVFPNPTRDQVSIRFDVQPGDKTSWSLFGSRGNVVKTGMVDGLTGTFSVDELPSGIYFLRIISGQKELKTFKIVKQ